MGTIIWPDGPLDFGPSTRTPGVDAAWGPADLSGVAASVVVVRTIARGGFGRVELVKPRKGGLTVARKVFDPKPEVLAGATPEKLKQRFRREVRVQSRLSSDFFIP